MTHQGRIRESKPVPTEGFPPTSQGTPVRRQPRTPREQVQQPCFRRRSERTATRSRADQCPRTSAGLSQEPRRAGERLGRRVRRCWKPKDQKRVWASRVTASPVWSQAQV